MNLQKLRVDFGQSKHFKKNRSLHQPYSKLARCAVALAYLALREAAQGGSLVASSQFEIVTGKEPRRPWKSAFELEPQLSERLAQQGRTETAAAGGATGRRAPRITQKQILRSLLLIILKIDCFI